MLWIISILLDKTLTALVSRFVRSRKHMPVERHSRATHNASLLLRSCTDSRGGWGGGYRVALLTVGESGVIIRMESQSTKSAVISDWWPRRYQIRISICWWNGQANHFKRHLVLGPNIKTEVRGKCLWVNGMECDSSNKPDGSVTTGQFFNT